MNRREAIKLSTIAALGVAVTASAKEAPYMNRMEMTPKDPKKLAPGELKHTPQITLGTKDSKGYTLVEITVGQGGIIHPSTPAHWIDFISLSADGKKVGTSTLEAEISRGTASFSVKLDGVKTLSAKAGCNLHGIWSSSLKV
ncbi:twin-arginine translocation pathway signal protein [Sulfurimonas aquatica]|uniref:Twin-arginine translocation pathway signal protein n=1 Tax=Sulfurimonas aquatica TaxID=2672570 RepID=A0A975GCK9_9BACT|nr:desulfoferrodoxin family protein [Sulfurimonas aquatica]QSZ41617.1 twin-arginine translocation pathway signal protein [Sulfurimonas aquatica]